MQKGELRESETLEFKRSTSELKEAIISIASMLNKHQAGTLYFGVKNDGTILGQGTTENTLREISKSIADHIEPKIYPEINIVSIKGKSCIEVQFSGSNIPYFAFRRAYIRVSDENRELSAKEIEAFILKKNKEKISWESEPSECPYQKLKREAVEEFIRRANIAGRIHFSFDNTKNILKKLHLIKGNRALKAVDVLFCEENKLEVQAAVFAGKERITFLDIKQFKGNLFSLLEKSEEYIKEHLHWSVKMGKLEREEIPEIPLKAIREALVNSFCHRDYYAPESNKIAIFNDRVEIWNPGEFPEGLTPEDFINGDEQSVLRNPLIANILYLSKAIEKWGSGLKRIFDECRENDINVEFKLLKTGFLVVFGRKEKRGETSQKTSQKTVLKVLDLLRSDPQISLQELAKETGLSINGVKYNLKALKLKGILNRIGSDKKGYWKVDKDKLGLTLEEVPEKVPEKVPERLTQNQEKILVLVGRSPKITISELSSHLGISDRKIKVNLSKLKKTGILRRIGPDKGGYWSVQA